MSSCVFPRSVPCKAELFSVYISLAVIILLRSRIVMSGSDECLSTENIMSCVCNFNFFSSHLK